MNQVILKLNDLLTGITSSPNTRNGTHGTSSCAGDAEWLKRDAVLDTISATATTHTTLPACLATLSHLRVFLPV